MFWSIYTSLLPSLFYFSVWKLGIAGAELALLTVLSPGFLGISIFRSWAASKLGRTVLHILSLTGLIAYRFKTPFERLLFVAFASVIVCIGGVVDWSGLSGQSPLYSSTRVCNESLKLAMVLISVTFSGSGRTWTFRSVETSQSLQQSQYVFKFSFWFDFLIFPSMAYVGRNNRRLQQDWYFPSRIGDLRVRL